MALESVDRHLARFLRHFCSKHRASARDCIFIPRARAIGIARNFLVFATITALLFIAGCGSSPKKNAPSAAGKSGGYYLDDGPGPNAPSNLDRIADAVPKTEPYHRGANKPYTVFGKTYVPNLSNDRFKQKGVASWYGRKFHGQKTANGETYDMYAMTAAHPTLPLPCYVRVSNPANGKAVIVRVNDRGPFLSERIIDLSFAAAHRLDIARRGSGPVVVERVFPGDKPNSAPPVEAPSMAVSVPVAPSVNPPDELPLPLTTATLAGGNIIASPISGDGNLLFLQLGAFSSRENAEIFRTRIQSELEWNREPILLSQSGNLYRVRLGPYRSRDEAQAIAEQVKASLNFSPIIAKP